MTPSIQLHSRKKISLLDRQIREIVQRYEPDAGHAEHVAALAVHLFDLFTPMHGFPASDRELLRIAALLHDIGWSRDGTGGHHKHSRNLILESTLDMPEADQYVCALVARYHRKSEPDPARHARFRRLPAADRHRVEWLAALLRVADGLDRSHRGNVTAAHLEITVSDIIVRIDAADDCETEIRGANRKINLLSRLTGRNVECKL